MFTTLPKPIQNKILEHLAANNFMAAKVVYDSWSASYAQSAKQTCQSETNKIYSR